MKDRIALTVKFISSENDEAARNAFFQGTLLQIKSFEYAGSHDGTATYEIILETEKPADE